MSVFCPGWKLFLALTTLLLGGYSSYFTFSCSCANFMDTPFGPLPKKGIILVLAVQLLERNLDRAQGEGAPLHGGAVPGTVEPLHP